MLLPEALGLPLNKICEEAAQAAAAMEAASMQQSAEGFPGPGPFLDPRDYAEGDDVDDYDDDSQKRRRSDRSKERGSSAKGKSEVPKEGACRNQTGYIGVRQRKWGMFAAEIRDGDKRRWLGSFASGKDAGLAYDAAAVSQKGSKAKTNFQYRDYASIPRKDAKMEDRVRWDLLPKDIAELFPPPSDLHGNGARHDPEAGFAPRQRAVRRPAEQQPSDDPEDTNDSYEKQPKRGRSGGNHHTARGYGGYPSTEEEAQLAMAYMAGAYGGAPYMNMYAPGHPMEPEGYDPHQDYAAANVMAAALYTQQQHYAAAVMGMAPHFGYDESMMVPPLRDQSGGRKREGGGRGGDGVNGGAGRGTWEGSPERHQGRGGEGNAGAGPSHRRPVPSAMVAPNPYDYGAALMGAPMVGPAGMHYNPKGYVMPGFSGRYPGGEGGGGRRSGAASAGPRSHSPGGGGRGRRRRTDDADADAEGEAQAGDTSRRSRGGSPGDDDADGQYAAGYGYEHMMAYGAHPAYHPHYAAAMAAGAVAAPGLYNSTPGPTTGGTLVRPKAVHAKPDYGTEPQVGYLPGAFHPYHAAALAQYPYMDQSHIYGGPAGLNDDDDDDMGPGLGPVAHDTGEVHLKKWKDLVAGKARKPSSKAPASTAGTAKGEAGPADAPLLSTLQEISRNAKTRAGEPIDPSLAQEGAAAIVAAAAAAAQQQQKLEEH